VEKNYVGFWTVCENEIVCYNIGHAITHASEGTCPPLRRKRGGLSPSPNSRASAYLWVSFPAGPELKIYSG